MKESAEQIESFWNAFLKETGRLPETQYLESFHFCIDEYWANKLLELVLAGKKCATASSQYAYSEQEPQPNVGDLSIVTDFAGTPHCVIETTAVTTLPFREMTYEICKREGEDDCLESWQKNHVSFFTQEGAKMGYEFSWDMPVVFEDFTVVYRKPRKDEQQ